MTSRPLELGLELELVELEEPAAQAAPVGSSEVRTTACTMCGRFRFPGVVFICFWCRCDQQQPS